MVLETQLKQDFINHGHTTTLYTYIRQPLHFSRYSPDKIFKLKLTTTRPNQGHTMMLHTYTLTNVPTKYQHLTSHGF